MTSTATAVKLAGRFAALHIGVLLVLCCAMAGGCNGREDGTGKAGGRIKPGEYPKPALDYIHAALEKPTEGYPALAYTWIVISQLDKLEKAPQGGAIRAKMAEFLEMAGSRPPQELISALLNCNEEQALALIKTELGKGNAAYVDALWYRPKLARELVADPATRLVNKNNLTAGIASRWLAMQAHWADVKPEDMDLLVMISERPNEPGNTLRAAGWILRLEPDNQRFIDYLKLGMKLAGPGKLNELSGATEGIKISRNPELTDILVEVVKHIQIEGDPPPAGEKETDVANPQQMLVVYALSALPGEQASLMRKKLFKARNAQLRWQARLGELLYGNPQPWNDALAAEKDLANSDLQVTLEAVDSPEPALLPTYRRMAESDNATVRLLALGKLGRFRPYADNTDVVELVTKLTEDKIPEVRSAAWYAAGKVGVGDPLKVVQDKKEIPEVRLAAAYAALMHAQGGPPDMRDAGNWSITGSGSAKEAATKTSPKAEGVK